MPVISPVKTAQLFGWSIVAEPFQIWWEKLLAQLAQPQPQPQLRPRPLTIFTPNPEIVVLAHHDSVFHQAVTQADYLIPDGIGLIWASSWGQTPIPERIAGTDVVARLVTVAAERHWRILVVGGRDYLPGTTPMTQPAQHLAELPGEVWWLPGYSNITEPVGAEEQLVSQELLRLKPTIVLVAFGAPHQEQWVISHQTDLQTAGVQLTMTVGGALDFLLGKVPRAPQWWQAHGLEWLYRLVRQPWRLKRQLALVEFGWLALWHQGGSAKSV